MDNQTTTVDLKDDAQRRQFMQALVDGLADLDAKLGYAGDSVHLPYAKGDVHLSVGGGQYSFSPYRIVLRFRKPGYAWKRQAVSYPNPVVSKLVAKVREIVAAHEVSQVEQAEYAKQREAQEVERLAAIAPVQAVVDSLPQKNGLSTLRSWEGSMWNGVPHYDVKLGSLTEAQMLAVLGIVRQAEEARKSADEWLAEEQARIAAEVAAQ